MGIRARVGVAVGAAVVLLLAVGGGIATARDGSGSSEGHGTFALASFKWHVERDSDGHVSGYFKAVGTQPAGLLVAPQGRVTCAEFDGNKVGFLYVLEDNTRPILAKGTYILITAEDNGGHGRDKVGFVGPAPREAFPGCQPSFTPFSVTSGYTRVDSDSDSDR
jgi:hypothetical protein